jgi:hypothetical protein
MSDWPRYESHKIVQAAKIVGFNTRDNGSRACAMVDPGDGVLMTFAPNVDEMLQRAEIGGYAVIYEDGFASISPAKAFEDGYVRLP